MLTKLAMAAIPPWVYALGAGILIAGAVGFVAYERHDAREEGKAEIQAKWDKSVERGRAIVADLQKRADKITVRTEIQYVDRVKVVHEQGREIERVRTVFVPTDSGYLTGGFRLYHDAAVTNTIPDPAAIPDAAPVSIAEATDTIAANYEKANVCYATVKAWQDWATEQCKLNDKGCPDGGR